MTTIDNVGAVVEDKTKFSHALERAVEAGLLDEEQSVAISQTAESYHSKNGVIHINKVFREAIGQNEEKFQNLNYKDFLRVDDAHSPRLAMLGLGIGIVVGFVWAMSD